MEIMNLLLTRNQFSKTCTIGELFIDGKFLCFTLEDILRDKKIWGETSIPAGKYKITLEYSPKFTPRYKTKLPFLHNVPNYQNILMHRGNTHLDTHGCILVGLKANKESIENSKEAFNLLISKIKEAIEIGKEVWIEIENRPFQEELKDVK